MAPKREIIDFSSYYEEEHSELLSHIWLDLAEIFVDEIWEENWYFLLCQIDLVAPNFLEALAGFPAEALRWLPKIMLLRTKESGIVKPLLQERFAQVSDDERQILTDMSQEWGRTLTVTFITLEGELTLFQRRILIHAIDSFTSFDKEVVNRKRQT